MAKNGTEVAKVETHAVALPQSMMDRLREQAKEAAAVERPKISKLGTRGGQLKYMGEPVAGNNMDVIILFASWRNTYYSGPFDPDNIKNPDCFALAESNENMIPGAENPVNPTCKGCPFNQWGSDIRADGVKRKGKACKESRRLILMPAQAVEDAAAIKTAELAILDLPVTSAANYGGFVNAVAATVGVPPWACVANIRTQPHPKNQFEVILTPLRVVPTAEAIEAIEARLEDAKKLGLEPYDETSDTNSPAIEAQRKRVEAAGKKF